MPSFFRYRTTAQRLLLWISGKVFSLRSLVKDLRVNKRKHLPGWVRPALPALCLALALLIGLTSRLSTLYRGLYTFYFDRPGSTTNTMPSMVSEVSAILVAKIILRSGAPLIVGAGSKILFCMRGESEP